MNAISYIFLCLLPVPYVCSCPSGFVGSYCEIPRDNVDLSFPYAAPSTLLPTTTSTTPSTTTTTTTTTTAPSTTKTEAFYSITEPARRQNPMYLMNNDVIGSGGNSVESRVDMASNNEMQQQQQQQASGSCEPNPCLNNAACIVFAKFFVCICVNNSYSGKYCEIYTAWPRQATQAPSVRTWTASFNPFTAQQTAATPPTPPMRMTTTTSASPFTEYTTAKYIWKCEDSSQSFMIAV